MLDSTLPLRGPFPHTYAIRPGASTSEVIDVLVRARLGDSTVVEQRTRTFFVEGEVRTIVVVLDPVCAGVMCEPGEECIDGVCRGMDASMPPDRDAGDPRRDAGQDAGASAGEDGSVDAGFDPDRCLGAEDCADEIACTVNTCEMGACEVIFDDTLCEPVAQCTSSGCRSPCGSPTVVPDGGGRFEVPLEPGIQTGSCGGDGPEGYLQLDLIEPRDVFIAAFSQAATPILYLRDTSCEGEEIACDADAAGIGASVLQRELVPGSYILVVDSEAAASGSVTVDVSLTAPAEPGDRCGDPLLLEGPSVMGTTCGREADTVLRGECDGQTDGLHGPDLVYYFTVTGSARTVAFSTCSGCTRFDSSLELRRACNEPMAASTRVACSADQCRSACARPPPNRTKQSEVRANLEPGVYFLVVDGRGSQCGDFEVRVAGL